ncbi:MAG: dTDP-4-dehydrorhamnose reductase [Hyphomicrobiaceae bacterium]
MKILVTGTEGQVARALAERAADRPDLDLLCMGRPDLDLARPETIERTVNEQTPDVVINAAAYTAVDRAEDEPDLAMRINGDAAGRIAGAAKSVGAKLIHLSTDYVYDGVKLAPYVETDAAAPQSAYGRSKLAGELQVHAQYKGAVILRTAWVYSPFGRNFVTTMLELARTRNQVSVVDDQWGNPTSAHDIADAVLTMADRWRWDCSIGAGNCYHCAGSGEATWYELAQHVFDTSQALGGPSAEVAAINSSEWPTQAKRPLNSRLNCNKLLRAFGWQAPEWRASVTDVVSRLLAKH